MNAAEYHHPMQYLYDQIPTIECKGLCGSDKANTCCGPIGCTTTEARLLDEYDGTQCDWVEASPGMVFQRFDSIVSAPLCPHLGLDGRCTAYEARPLICRLFGVVEKMPCQFGCKPSRVMKTEEDRRLFRAVKARSAAIEAGRGKSTSAPLRK